jgi:hypothetical protein
LISTIFCEPLDTVEQIGLDKLDSRVQEVLKQSQARIAEMRERGEADKWILEEEQSCEAEIDALLNGFDSSLSSEREKIEAIDWVTEQLAHLEVDDAVVQKHAVAEQRYEHTKAMMDMMMEDVQPKVQKDKRESLSKEERRERKEQDKKERLIQRLKEASVKGRDQEATVGVVVNNSTERIIKSESKNIQTRKLIQQRAEVMRDVDKRLLSKQDITRIQEKHQQVQVEAQSRAQEMRAKMLARMETKSKK